MKIIKRLGILVVLGAVGATGFVYSGIYNMAADEPHWPITFKLIESLRERSIAVRAESVDVPKLDDPKRIAEGAEHYGAMCSGCHLAPGMKDTEIRLGLYPQPPNLAEHTHGHRHGDETVAAARQFWIIKHGIKMTGMPAWGATHDDEAIWGLVAFLQKLPELSPEQYATMTAQAGAHSHGAAGHSHGGEPGAAPKAGGHVDPPGAPPHHHGANPMQKPEEHQHSH